MGAIARQGPHQVAQKSTRTGLSDFKTSWSKFASVTSTIPLPAIFFLLYVTSHYRRGCKGRHGTGDRMSASRRKPNHLPELPIVTPLLDARRDWKVARPQPPAGTLPWAGKSAGKS